MAGLSYLQPLQRRPGAKTRKKTMRHIFINLILTAGLLMGLLVFTGCESSGPEFANGETTSLIEGTLLLVETSDSHFQALTQSGTVNLELTDLTARNDEIDEVIEDYSLGVSVGLPAGDDAERCQVTFSKVLEKGESFSVYSREGIFCVVVFRPPEQAVEIVVSYLLTLSGAFS